MCDCEKNIAKNVAKSETNIQNIGT